MKTKTKKAERAKNNEEGAYATIEEIRKGLFGFMPALTRAMLGRFPPSMERCPVCGSKAVASRTRQSRVVIDGPTYLEMKCGKCGPKWRMLLRAGP